MNNTSIKVSVVVPIYKVEKFLPQCLESLANQTLQEIEFILVDDGSPDNCGKIADSWCEHDSRFKVIHQVNSGYGTAVSNGFKNATGEYLAILESDDWVEPTMYEKLYNAASKNNVEVSRCGFYIYDSTKSKNVDSIWEETKKLLAHCPSDPFSPLDYREIFYAHSAIWTYLFRRDLINKVKIDTSRKAYQDYPFIFEILASCKQLVVIKEYLHHYRMEENQGSSSMSKSKRALDMIDMTLLLKDRLTAIGKLQVLSKEFYQHSILANYYFFDKTPEEYKEYYIEKMHDLFAPVEFEICFGLSAEYREWFSKVKDYSILNNALAFSAKNLSSFDNNSIHIAFASDLNNIQFLAVALQSALQNFSPNKHYTIHCLVDALSFQQLIILNQICSSENVTLNILDVTKYAEKYEGLFVDRHLSIATYWRFLLPDILPTVSKILYIDTDIIVNKDLAELFSTNLDGNYVAGCVDQAVSICEYGDFKKAKKKLRDIHYSDFTHYLNGGVLLFNLSLIRKDNMIEKLFQLAANNSFVFHDQDVMNIAFDGRKVILNECWNFTTHTSPSMYTVEQQKKMLQMIANRSYGIIHYPGTIKPWNSSQGYLNSEWRMVASSNPFFIGAYFPSFYYQTESAPVKKSSLLSGGFQCIHDHGLMYTLSYLPGRLFSSTFKCLRDHGLWYTLCYIPKRIFRKKR